MITDISFVNDWSPRNKAGGWKARLCLFDLELRMCEGPPHCHARHMDITLVILNCGVHMGFSWGHEEPSHERQD